MSRLQRGVGVEQEQPLLPEGWEEEKKEEEVEVEEEVEPGAWEELKATHGVILSA